MSSKSLTVTSAGDRLARQRSNTQERIGRTTGDNSKRMSKGSRIRNPNSDDELSVAADWVIALRPNVTGSGCVGNNQ
jgi:hypothetical protein